MKAYSTVSRGDAHPPRSFRLRVIPEIEGVARQNIAGELSWHGNAAQIEHWIRRLPAEREIELLSNTEQQYLAMTLYSLKQMQATGAVLPDTAWELFNFELATVKRSGVDDRSLPDMRSGFLVRIHNGIRSGREFSTYQEFEFWARAGEAAQRRMPEYYCLGHDQLFDEETRQRIGLNLREEHKRAIFLEMCLAEERTGLTGTNRSGAFKRSNNSGFYGLPVRDSQFLIAINRTEGIDSALKSEISHWLFEHFPFKHGWAGELLGRMNAAGYSPRVNQAFAGQLMHQLSPEALSFIGGGGAHSQEISESSSAARGIARVMEHGLRERVIRAFTEGKVRQDEIYQMYWKLGIYAGLLDSEGRSRAQIRENIERFNRAEIEDYFASVPERIHKWGRV